MYTIKERVAIARILSDMIKADNIIEESEIQMLNRFRSAYNIDNSILCQAHYLKFSEAVSDLSSLSDENKVNLFKSIREMALADGACVPREAMLLLALRYCLGIVRSRDGGYSVSEHPVGRLISCPTGEATITSSYVIYVEGRYSKEINADIQHNFEVNVLNLRQWGFDFIYIPNLVSEFRQMNQQYVKDVIGYMDPKLSPLVVDSVYERLLRMDTVTFCNYVLADQLQVVEVRNAVPSLFINIGSSIVSFSDATGSVGCYTEFLCIPLRGDITGCIRDFVGAYSRLVSFFASPNPAAFRNELPNRFKYFGFYKALFDFLVKAEPKESDMVIYPWLKVIEFPDCQMGSLSLSPQEAAVYKLILEFTYNHSLGGLPTSYTAFQKEIEQTYCKIYHRQSPLPDNLAPIRSRIESKMRKQLSGLANIDDMIPKLVDGKYTVTSPVERIKIRENHYEPLRCFKGYHWK